MIKDDTFDITVHHVRFTCEALTAVHFGPQAGAQIRGGLWHSLEAITPGIPVESAGHPLQKLMEMERASYRGVNPVRPLAIRPPLAPRMERDRVYETGTTFSFEVALYGNAAETFHYIALAINHLGEHGVGYRRGRFSVTGIHAYNPFTGMEYNLLTEGRRLQAPNLPVNAAHISTFTAALPGDAVRLRFLTPAQIRRQKKVLSQPDFPTLIARLLERCQALESHYGQPVERDIWRERHNHLTNAAKHIQIGQDNTRWVQVRAGSRRSDRRLDLGGIVGDVLFTGDHPDALLPFLEWIVWGVSLHVGKNAVKGDGWYELG